MQYVLGLDLGTSSTKGLLFEKNEGLVATATADYPLITPDVGYSEQNPNEWFKATKEVVREILKKCPDAKDNLDGISFSGQMHSLVLLDSKGVPLRNAILWNDVRTTKQCKKIMDTFGSETLQVTKNVALEGFTLPKILWVQENEPDIWEKARHILLPKDYLAYCLTGKLHMDYSDAAGTLLLDIVNGKWSSEMLERFKIDSTLMPKLIGSFDLRGELLPNIADVLGLKQNVKVFGGGADNACAALASGIVSENLAMCSIGTSGVFLGFEKSHKVNYNGKLHLFNHVIPNAYYSMGVTLSAGHSLTWFKNAFAPNLDYEALLKDISKVPVGSDSLLFTPYIMGERTPYADSKIRGSCVGINASHTLNHFARAVLEGITFSLKDSQNIMEILANKWFKKVVSVGGGSQNNDWLQMQADIFNANITSLQAEQGPGLGAAMLASIGSGWYETVEKCTEHFVQYGNVFSPHKTAVQQYKKFYDIYAQVYRHTAPLTHQLLDS
jgi:xylulokinase